MERGHLIRILLRRSFTQPTTEGDKRELFGQGRPQAKDSVAAWATGISSDPQNIAQGTAKSRFSFIGTVAAADMSRATDSREAGRMGIFGSALSYGGSYGRVTSESIGRDVNPLGRGTGMALVGGAQNLSRVMPTLPYAIRKGLGSGNSSNNDGMPTPDCPDKECEGGGKYAEKFYSSNCMKWHQTVWEHEDEWRSCKCLVHECPPSPCKPCSAEHWRQDAACCYCMECKARERDDHKCDYPCKYRCDGPSWCQMPDDCYCQGKSDGGQGGGDGGGSCWIVKPGGSALG